MSPEPGEPGEGPAPLLRVVHGDPTPEELAALVAVLTSLTPSAPAAPRVPRPWNAPARLHRTVHPHGVAGWRTSGLPR
ncbi:MAG: acyl-CoA carboxylase subunit epsilon [Nocardioides sp.]